MSPMRNPVRAVVFDLGSTLIYETGAWDDLFERADVQLWRVLRGAGVGLDRNDLYGESGNLFQLYYSHHRGDLSEPTTVAVLDELLRKKGYHLEKETLRAAVRALFRVTQANWLAETDALPTLKWLKERRFQIGLISNASDDDNTQALIDKGRFRPFLDCILSSAAFGKRKPHPDIFLAALARLKAPAAEAAMVGDDYEADILGANGVGMQSIWITRRVPRATWPPNPQASAVIGALGEIPALLDDAR